MGRLLSILGFAGALALVAAGCGDTPKVYRKIPRVDSKKMAVGAAAVAGALTLAGAPSRGGPKKEKPGDADKRPVKTKESVPSDVLDRLEDDEDDAEQKPDCAEPGKDRAAARPKNRVELIPTETESGAGIAPPQKRDECKDRDNRGDDTDTDDIESPGR